MTYAYKTASAIALLESGTSGPGISTSMDLLFNLASSLGTRDRTTLNFEFKRNISVNMK
jgi:hypothetical protein